MTIEWNTVVLIVLTVINLIVLGPLAWIVRSLIADYKELRQEIMNLQNELAVNYVRTDVLNRAVDDFKQSNRDSIEALRREIIAWRSPPPPYSGAGGPPGGGFASGPLS